MNRVNLLPGSVLDERRRRRRRSLWVRSVSAYATVILGGALLAEGVFVEPADALDAELLRMESDRTAVEAGIVLLEQQEAGLAREVEVLGDIFGQPDWGILLAHVGRHLDDGASLRSIRVTLTEQAGASVAPSDLARGPYQVEISGITRDQAQVTAYVLRLENAGLLNEVVLKGTSPARLGDAQGVGFSLSAVVRVGGP